MKGNGMTFLPGPKPGSDKSVNMRKAMAAGCEMASAPRRVKLSQKTSTTGSASSPGLTNRKR